MAAIDAAMQKDQGAKYRGLLKELMPLSSDAYDTREEDWRDHLGASLIGRDCPREIWYGFHWATKPHFDGRMLRLFNRGHLEEPRMIALLMLIGCQVWQLNSDGKQFRIKGHRGHFGGSLDGVVRGIPDMPDETMLGEFKTHNDKSFTTLTEDGVINAKWEHFIQMQEYMGKYHLNYALYCATNKNTDAIHMEIVQFDQVQYQRYLDRSAMIIDATEPPPRIGDTPGFYKCKFCDHVKVCHLKETPVVNCRTCLHSQVEDNGEWRCTNFELVSPTFDWDGYLTPETQRRSDCPFYTPNPVFHNKV
jgi:hypothetical protein